MFPSFWLEGLGHPPPPRLDEKHKSRWPVMRYAAEQAKRRARAIFLFFFSRPTTTLVRAADFSAKNPKRTPKTNYSGFQDKAHVPGQVDCATENGDERQKWRHQRRAAADD